MKIRHYMAFATFLVISSLGGDVAAQTTWTDADIAHTRESAVNQAIAIAELYRSSGYATSTSRSTRRALEATCTIPATDTTEAIQPYDGDPCPAFTRMRSRLDDGEFVTAEDFAPFQDLVRNQCVVDNPTDEELLDPCPRSARIEAEVAALREDVTDLQADLQLTQGGVMRNAREIDQLNDRVHLSLGFGGGVGGGDYDTNVVGSAALDFTLGGSGNWRGSAMFNGGTDFSDPHVGGGIGIGYRIGGLVTPGVSLILDSDRGDPDRPGPAAFATLVGPSLDVRLGKEIPISVYMAGGGLHTDMDGQLGWSGGVFGVVRFWTF